MTPLKLLLQVTPLSDSNDFCFICSLERTFPTALWEGFNYNKGLHKQLYEIESPISPRGTKLLWLILMKGYGLAQNHKDTSHPALHRPKARFWWPKLMQTLSRYGNLSYVYGDVEPCWLEGPDNGEGWEEGQWEIVGAGDLTETQ